MNKQDLKNLILSMRDNDGKSFGAIASVLKSEYEYETTRQNVQGHYNRAKKQEAMENNVELKEVTVDVINLFCRGFNATEITTIMPKMGYNISYSNVNRLIRNPENEKYMESTIKELTDMIKQHRVSQISVEEILDKLSYNGIEVTIKTAKSLFVAAYRELIEADIVDKLSELYGNTESYDVVKEIGERFNVRVTLNELKKRDKTDSNL